MSAHEERRKAILEARIKGAVTSGGTARTDTVTGSLAVHTVNHNGSPAVLVTWQQGIRLTPERWAQVAADLGLEVASE